MDEDGDRRAGVPPIGERRSCRIADLSGSLQQYRSTPKNDMAAVGLKEQASENRRYGCFRLHAMLRRKALFENRKQTYRLCIEQGLQAQEEAAQGCRAANER